VQLSFGNHNLTYLLELDIVAISWEFSSAVPMASVETIYSDIPSLQYGSISPELNLKQQWWLMFLKDWHRSLWNSVRLMLWLTQLSGRPIAIIPWCLKNKPLSMRTLCGLF
jgi:hypothetical protein